MAPGSDDVSQDLSNDPPRGIRRVAGDKEARSLWSGRPQRAAAKGRRRRIGSFHPCLLEVEATTVRSA
jgi:hypothetical protein